MHVERWRGSSAGRSRIVAYANTVWAVAIAEDECEF